MKKVPREVLWAMPWGLGATLVSNLDPTYYTPTKTKHTCEPEAALQVQAGELHVLEHLDITWGNGVVIEEGMKKVPGKVLQTRP